MNKEDVAYENASLSTPQVQMKTMCQHNIHTKDKTIQYSFYDDYLCTCALTKSVVNEAFTYFSNKSYDV